mmetsp:Transcript_2299/g.4260  ORF Transcript_2299/g.4260 Transcript_2299/m.4260 type:complete len:428 (-) Transcript_2299:1087-2370(-)
MKNSLVISHNTQLWKVLWPVLSASGVLLVLSSYSRLEKIVKGQLHKWNLSKIIKEESSKRETSKSDYDQQQQKEQHQQQDEIKISSLFIHPIKSLRPVSVSSAKLTTRGVEGDRCLMLVRPSPSTGQYRFLTQRQCPNLATINVSLPRCVKENNETTTVIEISNSDHSRNMLVDITYPVTTKLAGDKKSPRYYNAGIWDDVVQVVDLGDEASSFVQSLIASNSDTNANANAADYQEDFSDIRLVMQVPNDNRRVDEQYCPFAAMDVMGRVPKVSLTDGFPILIASEESLRELNRRLVEKGKDAIPMSRFRPNIVVEGSSLAAFEEDEWKAIQIGGGNGDNGAILHIVKGCPRCKQSCTDQLTGERFEEPLETLKEFRALGINQEDVYFAQNVVLQPGQEGKVISVGDSVRILTRGNPVWDMGSVQAE